MDWTVNKCIKCSLTLEEDEEVYKCYICKQELHKKCANLTASELKCMPLQKRSLRLICTKCDNFITKLPDLLSMVEGIQKDMSQMKENMYKFSSGQSNGNHTQNYADVLRQKPEPVIVVKPVNAQTSNLTKTEIKQAIDPTDIGVNISQLKQVSKGAVVISCEHKSDIDVLKTKISEKIGNKYNVEVPTLRKPKLKVVNIHNEDTDVDDNQLVNKIMKQNKINSDTDDIHIRIVKKISNKRFDTSTLIIETDPLTHRHLLKNEKVNVGWSKGNVYNHVNLLQCYNCFGFNHAAKNCKAEMSCSKCSLNHNYKDCDSQKVQCTNCIRAQLNLNIVLDTNHEAISKDCPCFQRQMSKLNQKIEYCRE